MTPARIVSLRRVPLTLACRSLSATDLQLLLALVLGACPRTGRAWTTPLRLAEEFCVAPSTVQAAFSSLVERGFLTLWSRSTSALALRCYDLSPLLARERDEPPDNLPVEPPS
jgi:hypothetical protein